MIHLCSWFPLLMILVTVTSHFQPKRTIMQDVPDSSITKNLLMKVGGDLCNALKHYYGIMYCDVKPKCLSSFASDKIVLSYGHNGVGNQLWQHTFARNVAKSINARFYAGQIPRLVTNDRLPPHTELGTWMIKNSLPRTMLWDKLPQTHKDRVVCSDHNVTFFDRRIDHQQMRNSAAYRSQFNNRLIRLLDKTGDIRCIVLLGFFQGKDILCSGDVRDYWKGVLQPHSSKQPSLTQRLKAWVVDSNSASRFPSKCVGNKEDKISIDDFVIYMRCSAHYAGPSISFLDTVLKNAKYRYLWILKQPGSECRNTEQMRDSSISHVPEEYLFADTIAHMRRTYNAKMWRGVECRDSFHGNSSKKIAKENLLEDFRLLASGTRYIMTHSTWYFWAAFLSESAKEIHVDVSSRDPTSGLVHGDRRYIYHDIEGGCYFGHFDDVKSLLVYHNCNHTKISYFSR